MNLAADDIMIHPVVTIREDKKVSDLVQLLDENQITGVPVVNDDDTLVGVVSITDLLALGMDDSYNLAVVGSDFHTSPAMDGMAKAQGLLAPAGAVLGRSVKDILSPEVITAGREETIGDLAGTMVTNSIHRIIITDDSDKIVGIVSVKDILHALRDRYKGK